MSFFVAGGTVPPGSPSYVERAADREIFEALLAGEFCFVLNSRQMGKSSLAVRTIAKLNDAGVQTAFVDLTRLGATGADAERWYAGLLVETGRALGLRGEAMAYLRAHPELPATTRLFSFLRDEALVRTSGSIVLMIDEIDAVRTLPFAVDDLFAGLRELWNARASDPKMARLTICLLGAALPSDLIRDPRRTPFNIGRRIELRDFTPDEARPYATQVGDEALARVLHWTNGHPFLTQALCAELSTPPLQSGGKAGEGDRTGRPGTLSGRGVHAPDVDALVQSRYLDARARETDTNLTDVGRRLLGEGHPNVDDEGRATTLVLYERMLKGKAVADDEANPAAARIKMSGVARVESGELRCRNRIYAKAFDARWVRENTPGQELRRQTRAFWKGVLRTGGIAAVVIAAIAGLAWNNWRLARIAETQRLAALKDYYAAAMRELDRKQDANDVSAIGRTLEALRDNSSRGWEWDHWNLVAHPADRTIAAHGVDYCIPSLSADGRSAVLTKGDGLEIYDLQKGLVARIALPETPLGHWVPAWLRTGELLLYDVNRKLAVVDVERRKVVHTADLPFSTNAWSLTGGPLGSTLPLFQWLPNGTFKTVLLDTRTLTCRPFPAAPGTGIDSTAFSLDGSLAASFEGRLNAQGRPDIWAAVRSTADWHTIRSFPVEGGVIRGFSWSADRRWLVYSNQDGRIWRVDLQSHLPVPKLVTRLSKNAYNARISPDGRRILACGDREACVLNAATGRVLAHYPEASYAWFVDEGHSVVTYYWDFRLYRSGVVENGVREFTLPRATYSAFSRIESTGRVVAARADESRTVSLDVHRPAAVRQSSEMHGLDSRGLVRIDRHTSGMRLLDTNSGRPWPAQPNFSLATFAAVTADRRTLVTSLRERTAAVYDATSTSPKALLSVSGVPACAEFSHDDRCLAIGNSRGVVTFFDSRTWKQRGSIETAGVPVTTLGFSRDGRSLFCFDDQRITIVDVASCRVRTRLIGNSRVVLCAAFHPDGTRIATGAEDGTVRLWDPQDGRELTVLGHHPTSVVALGFVDEGRTLVSVGSDGSVRLWMTEDRR